MVLNLDFLVYCNCNNWFKHLVMENGRSGYFVRFGEVFWATSVAAANRRSVRSSLGRCILNCRSVFVMTLFKIRVYQYPIILKNDIYLTYLTS